MNYESRLASSYLTYLEERRQMMSENKTDEFNGSRSFEERVLARFDSLDTRFDSMDNRFDRLEARIEVLEAKEYDTKPIWERALAAIEETNLGLKAVNERLDATNERLDATNERLETGLKAVNNRLDQNREDFDFALRGVERKIDVLNQNILDLRAEQRYVDRRLEKLESPPKPS